MNDLPKEDENQLIFQNNKDKFISEIILKNENNNSPDIIEVKNIKFSKNEDIKKNILYNNKLFILDSKQPKKLP